jgi:hypothetical protein
MVRFKLGVKIDGGEWDEFFQPVKSKKSGKEYDTWHNLI